jgi:hypothetical protein
MPPAGAVTHRPQETAFSTNMIAPRTSIHPRWIPPTQKTP